MKRRDFVKTLSAGACLSGLGSIGLSGTASAATIANQHIVFVQANGGWDVTSMWDPKGSEIDTYRGPMNKYSKNDIRRKGRISYAPVPEGVESKDWLHTFTQKHYQRMLVINGIDQGTNSHRIGGRVCMKGNDVVLAPTTAAMLGALYASEQPMAFIAESSHEGTAGLVPVAKLGDPSSYLKLGDKDNIRFVGNVAASNLEEQKTNTLLDLIDSNDSPRRLEIFKQHLQARQSAGEIAEFSKRLPATISNSKHLRQPELIAAALASGMSSSAQYGLGGFDSHNNNDQRQFTKMDDLLQSVDHLWDQLEAQGIAHKTTVVMVSDLGRTPGYNKSNGKDHWPVTSMVLMGAGVTGNRVIGGTNDELKPVKVNAKTWLPDQNGTLLTSAMVHQTLRNYLGFMNSPADLKYPLESKGITAPM
jgi:hypothetical protein